MAGEHESVLRMWTDYLRSAGEDPAATGKKYESWHFTMTEEGARELLELVLAGRKRATTSLFYAYGHEGSPIPKAGDLNIVTDWQGIARCIIRDTTVNILPYEDVTEEFARKEGEGDLSLVYWKEVHYQALKLECEGIGIKFDPRMPVVLEEFEVVYQ
jgi:uncharacterized protein YhfF